MIRRKYLCLHAHFYQPARGNPVTGEVGVEPSAAPYQNWNERITAECYRPNAELGNLQHLSFNFNETLLTWLERRHPDVYQMVLDADRYNVATYGAGNAVASTMHHTILPLARRRDKRTQVAWGRAAFIYRFGRPPEGIWLPEMAADLETLSVIQELGFQFTILSRGQIASGPKDEKVEEPAGPYWVALPGGERIAVFVRHERFSRELAFNIGTLGGAAHWTHRALMPYRRYAGPLSLAAVDGETFGHHHQGEYQFLRWLMRYEAAASGYPTTTLARFFQDNPPQEFVEIKERTSWSCYHGLARWVSGCDCTPGPSNWKGALRRALDNLAHEIDLLYVRMVEPLGVDPWALRDGYMAVIFDRIAGPGYLAQAGLRLDENTAARVLDMLRAQYHAQVMYTSCAFFFENLNRPEPRYAIANAAYALHLARRATGVDLSGLFRNDLAVTYGGGDGSNGMEIYDAVVRELGIERLPG
ncbi:MAG: DUF3536 domain-containing protein [Anaerolineae bacterium]|nr:DUF3536 domain-containing protein [Anaerolineae bacterium]